MGSPDLKSVSRSDKTSLQQRSGKFRRVFVGPQGLRSGWRIALFWGAFAAVAVAGALLLKRFAPMPHGPVVSISAGRLLLMECVQLSAVVVATFVIAKVERRSPLAYGLRGSARAARLATGLLSGFAGISVLVGILWRAGFLHIEAGAHHGLDALKFGLAWAVVFLAVALFEEMTLRGYLQHTLARAWGFGRATLFTSLLFGAIHGINQAETIVGLFMATGFGLIACLSLWYTGSLWWAIGCHVGWDWGESFFYGVGDSGIQAQGALLSAHPAGSEWFSGGSAGPEGSLLSLAVLFVMALLMWARWRRRGAAFARAAV